MSIENFKNEEYYTIVFQKIGNTKDGKSKEKNFLEKIAAKYGEEIRKAISNALNDDAEKYEMAW